MYKILVGEMSFNLIDDAWFPVVCSDGGRRNIAPWQIADPDIVEPDWPRPDLNVACYEFLIGLICLADPPAHLTEWNARKQGDPERLRAKLAPFALAFNLIGDGPHFHAGCRTLARWCGALGSDDFSR